LQGTGYKKVPTYFDKRQGKKQEGTRKRPRKDREEIRRSSREEKMK